MSAQLWYATNAMFAGWARVGGLAVLPGSEPPGVATADHEYRGGGHQDDPLRGHPRVAPGRGSYLRLTRRIAERARSPAGELAQPSSAAVCGRPAASQRSRSSATQCLRKLAGRVQAAVAGGFKVGGQRPGPVRTLRDEHPGLPASPGLRPYQPLSVSTSRSLADNAARVSANARHLRPLPLVGSPRVVGHAGYQLILAASAPVPVGEQPPGSREQPSDQIHRPCGTRSRTWTVWAVSRRSDEEVANARVREASSARRSPSSTRCTPRRERRPDVRRPCAYG